MTTKFFMDIENTIFGVIKKNLTNKLKDKYPEINFTLVESSTKNAKFPSVYIHMLPMAETGQDLEGTTINAVRATVQVDVTTNKDRSDAKTVIYAVVEELKRMRFSINAMPEFTKDGDDIHRAIMRANRIVGSGDTFL